jgi:hypothetical protein
MNIVLLTITPKKLVEEIGVLSLYGDIDLVKVDQLSSPGIYRNLKQLCVDRGWSYNTLSRKGKEFEFKGFNIKRSKI